jgi:hypothetical protein
MAPCCFVSQCSTKVFPKILHILNLGLSNIARARLLKGRAQGCRLIAAVTASGSSEAACTVTTSVTTLFGDRSLGVHKRAVGAIARHAVRSIKSCGYTKGLIGIV